ncbi:hypothetical protein HY772_07120, partial [Candidatus Woesearchaeota archaeon]|nr:hypothetical protein [Candidatus Woesearchaeota archaeon]
MQETKKFPSELEDAVLLLFMYVTAIRQAKGNFKLNIGESRAFVVSQLNQEYQNRMRVSDVREVSARPFRRMLWAIVE